MKRTWSRIRTNHIFSEFFCEYGIKTAEIKSRIKENLTFTEEIITVCLSPSSEYEIVKESKGDDYRS